MTTALTCPRCGHPVSEHAKKCEGISLGRVFTSAGAMMAHIYCDCPLSEAKATRLAQRRKAAEQVKKQQDAIQAADSLAEISVWGAMLLSYLQALRDTCILGENETEAELLKELGGEKK